MDGCLTGGTFYTIVLLMRTTIDIPEPLLRRAKAAASLDGKSLRAYVTEALEQHLTHERVGGYRAPGLLAAGAFEHSRRPADHRRLARARLADEEERAAGR